MIGSESDEHEETAANKIKSFLKQHKMLMNISLAKFLHLPHFSKVLTTLTGKNTFSIAFISSQCEISMKTSKDNIVTRSNNDKLLR